MPDRPGRAALSGRATSLRYAMWGVVGVAAVLLLAAFAGAKQWIPIRVGAAALWLFGASVALILWLGFKARAQALADRERQSGQAMIVAIAAQLARQDETILARIAGRDGPAAEAAQLILAGRRKAALSGGHATPA
ncbi:MAG: hypothetical protein ABI742_02835 [Gemmatimonadota bacterium]